MLTDSALIGATRNEDWTFFKVDLEDVRPTLMVLVANAITFHKYIIKLKFIFQE